MSNHNGRDFINELYAGVASGAICITLLPQKRNIWIDASDKEKIHDVLQEHQDTNVYLGLCPSDAPKTVYQRTTRESASVFVGAVIDIDVFNPEAHSQEALPQTKAEALQFVAELELPEPTAIIDTGNGFQAFWLLDSALVLSDEDAKKKAERLSFGINEVIIKAGLKRGWKFDNVGDIARIVRAPDTVNIKGSSPKSTKVQALSGMRYSYDELASFLSSDEDNATKTIQFERPIAQDRGENNTTNLASIYAACQFIRHWVEDAKTLPEPLWYAGLTVIARTLNGIKDAHKYSSLHPQYSENETTKKIQQALSATGPVGCKQVNKLGFEGCMSCPLFYSENLKSPISLGNYDEPLAELLGSYAYNIQTAQFAEARQ